MRRLLLASSLLIGLGGLPAFAQATVEERLEALEKENRKLHERLDELSDDAAAQAERTDTLAPVINRVTGYLDVGFFAVTGNGGVGMVTDLGHRVLPQFGYVPDSWVFLGDPLSTAINARGEPADTGESRAVTFDPIRSGGKPTFSLNTLSLNLFFGINDRLTFTGALDFMPRTRVVSDPRGLFLGDYLDVKLAYAEFLTSVGRVPISVYLGKFDSVLGIEYRGQNAPDRLTVTPSLICRYTCGRPVGIKARALFFDEAASVMLAVTNGSQMSELFGFVGEIDTNFFKTVSGRASWKFPLGAGLEIGVSGSVGAQDNQPDDSVIHWHYGVDLRLAIRHLVLSAEFVNGLAPGKTEPGAARCGETPCLRYNGGYGQAGYSVTNWLMPYLRVDGRSAVHLSGASFVYVSKLIRTTIGARIEPFRNLLVKFEYTFNTELDPVPQIQNDVFTSSAVVSFD